MRPYLYQRTEALPSSVFFKQPEFDPINFNIPAISCVASGLPQAYDGKLTASAAVGTQTALTPRLACTNCIASRAQTGMYQNHFQDPPAKRTPEDVFTNTKNWTRD